MSRRTPWAEYERAVRVYTEAGAAETVQRIVTAMSRLSRRLDVFYNERFDALDISLASGKLPTRGGVKPHITVTISLDDLIEAGKHATGDLTYGDGLSASAIRRLACDGGVIPVVLGSDSQPLDVGREKRYVTDGLRSA